MDAKTVQGISAIIMTSFNPRARDGREDHMLLLELHQTVSIHAPVMDAKTVIAQLLQFACFNPRARDGREGSDRSEL